MASDAVKSANAQAQRNFEQQQRTADAQRDQDYQRQEHFAKHGVQWRAEDARQAGIHPLYALGGNFATYSGSPVTVGAPSVHSDTSMGSAVASMGQDIGRAINSTRTGSQREDAFNSTVQSLTLQKMGLENQLLASQIKRLQVNSNPAFPSSVAAGATLPIPEGSAESRPPLFVGNGGRIMTDPTVSNAEDYTKRYGDEGPPAWLSGLYVGYKDLMHTSGGSPFTYIDRVSSLPIGDIVPTPSQIRSGMKKGWYPR